MKKKTILILSAIATALLINASAYAIQGDLDGSGIVDGLDLAILSTSFGLDSASPGWKEAADIARSGLVDGDDLSSLAPNFGQKAGVGSVAANIVWDDGGASGPMSKPNNLASKPLAKVANIDTVFINISAADMATISKSFSYSSMQGEIGGVPPGTRTLTVTGYEGVTPVYKGTKTITVTAGRTTIVTIYATAIDLTDTVVPRLAGGKGHSLALKSDGTIWAWGLNDVGQFGDSTQASSAVPVDTNQVETNQTGYIDLDSNFHHAIGIRFDGTVWTWGSNDCGQLGNGESGLCFDDTGTIKDENYPINVVDMSGEPFANATAVSAGALHTVALKNDGTVWNWGGNLYRQLGDGTDVDKSLPVQVNISSVTRISAGTNHTLALKSDGSVWAWGANDYGQIGKGGTAGGSVLTATQVFPNLTAIVDISAGGFHNVALANDATIWAWGNNSEGQIGQGFANITAVTSPVQVLDESASAPLSAIKAIAAGDYFTLALAGDGKVYTWGRNDFGQLGYGTTTDSAKPIDITSYIPEEVVAIFAGDEHALVMTISGDVWAWGRNSDDQLGAVSLDICVDSDGFDVICRKTPLQVPSFNLLN